MAKLVKILEEGLIDLENDLDVIAPTPTIKNKFKPAGPTRKFRPLTDAQKSLYGAIDANPELFSVQAAVVSARKMARKLPKND
jgi:hypothetical protein